MLFSTNVAAEQPELRFGYDINLGLPIFKKSNMPTPAFQQWQKFKAENNIKLIPYKNIQNLISDINNNRISIALISAGSIFYLEDINQYDVIAIAIDKTNGSNQLTTKVVINKSSSNIRQTDVKPDKFKLIYINKFCTTSYFAPLLYFQKFNFKQIILVGGYQAQFDFTNKNPNSISSIWTYILETNQHAPKNYAIVGKVTNLPAPIIIVNKNVNSSIIKQLENYLTQDFDNNMPGWGFKGFEKINHAELENLNRFIKNVCAKRSLLPFPIINCTVIQQLDDN